MLKLCFSSNYHLWHVSIIIWDYVIGDKLPLMKKYQKSNIFRQTLHMKSRNSTFKSVLVYLSITPIILYKDEKIPTHNSLLLIEVCSNNHEKTTTYYMIKFDQSMFQCKKVISAFLSFCRSHFVFLLLLLFTVFLCLFCS